MELVLREFMRKYSVPLFLLGLLAIVVASISGNAVLLALVIVATALIALLMPWRRDSSPESAESSRGGRRDGGSPH